ncbi:MAG: M48 family metalloprotease [Nitrospinae bacterium]|nr:M48 family metalloprotease [Nitrospinota bacterium]
MKKILSIFIIFIAAWAGALPHDALAGSKDSPLGGLGKALGLDEKTIGVIEKGAGAVQSLKPIQYEEEKAIGGGVALKVFARFGGAYPNEDLVRYVSMVGKSVALASDRPDKPYWFAVLNSEEPNAFAAPGGYIFVTFGLLKKLENEAQLAGVLGHEIAHVAKRHSLQTIERGKRLHGFSEFSLAVMDQDPKLFSDVIDNVSELLFTKGMDHSLEYEADRLGTQYAAKLGYQPQGLKQFLDKLSRHQSGGGGSVFFQTHPPTKSRVDELAAKTLPAYPDPKVFKPVGQRFKSQVKNLWTSE